MTASRLVDGLVFVGPSLFGRDGSGRSLLAAMRAAGVAACVIAPNKPPGYEFAPLNDWVLELASTSPEQFLPVCRVDPWQGTRAAAEVDRACRAGARGVLLHPWEECFSVTDEVAADVVGRAGAHGVPVLVPGGFPWVAEALQLAALATRFPDVVLLVGNGAQLNMSGLAGGDVERALDTCPNLAVQTSGVYRQDFLEATIGRIGPERVVYASCWPVFDLQLEAERARRTRFPSVGAERLVLGGNVQRWFGAAPCPS